MEDDVPTVRSMPGDNRYPGDPRQIGFRAEPGERHVENAAETIRQLAAATDGTGAKNGEPLRVCLTLVRLPPGLPFNLFGFHLVEVDHAGTVQDQISADQEILYALVTNQPVAMLREIAVRFLLDLITRTIPIRQVVRDEQPVGALPRLIDETNATASDLAWDLPPERPQAIDAIAEHAAAAELTLHVRFQLDPFPRQQDIAPRVSALRDLYNKEEMMRDAVDRTVSAIGARDGSLRGGREDVRAFVRQQLTLQGTRQFFNQVVRDAEVCGNGYLVGGFSGLDSEPRCLRPELVTVNADGRILEEAVDGIRSFSAREVAHFPGIAQLDSPYGISMLEPFLYAGTRRRIARSVRALNSDLPAHAPESVRTRARELLTLADLIERETDEQVRRLLGFFSSTLQPASEDLYFPGQERLA
jgi:hypothetical protein